MSTPTTTKPETVATVAALADELGDRAANPEFEPNDETSVDAGAVTDAVLSLAAEVRALRIALCGNGAVGTDDYEPGDLYRLRREIERGRK